MPKLWTFLAFLFALLITYGSDLAPYYISFFSGNKVTVFGSLYPWQERCPDSPREDTLCATQYRIPREVLKGHSDNEVLGLGMIIQAVEVYCDGRETAPVVLSNFSPGARMKVYYENYQIIPLSQLSCDRDLIIKNWVNKDLRRFGYSNAPAAIGDANWITRIKDLAEFFHGELNVLIAVIFLMFFLVVKSLRKFTSIDLTTTPLEPWSLYWFWFSLTSSDLVLDLFLPFSFGFWARFITHLTYFLCAMMTFGPCFSALASARGIPIPVRKWAQALILPRRWLIGFPLLLLLALGINLGTPVFLYNYSTIMILASIGSMLIALFDKNLLLLFFGLAALSDAGKVMMLPYFPAPRFVLVYMGLVLLIELVDKIYVFERSARLEGEANLAIKVAHDIRTPLNTLRLLLPHLSEVPEDKRMLVGGALGRIHQIASELLTDYRNQSKEFESLKAEYIPHIMDQVIAEMKLQYTSSSQLHFRIERTDNVDAYCRVSPAELIRTLSNIIHNSVQAIGSEPGEIVASIHSKAETVFISISDNGPGIPKDLLMTLGQAKVSPNQSHKTSGAGVGLYHAKQLANRWKGKLSIESAIGSGTKVTLSLPKCEQNSDD